jgi:hypothetical protein
MALNDNIFSTNLQALYASMAANPMSTKDFADKMAKLYDDQTKTAEVNAGINVNIPTTSPPGSPSAGTTISKGVIA